MVPRDHITEWRAQADWVSDLQVEQDLVISRVLVELFARPGIAKALAFRGGTALNKLPLRPAARHSEDIDLVKVPSGPIGPVLKEIHAAHDPWLGEPRWKQGGGRFPLSYRLESEDLPPVRMKLKVGINAREHFTVFGQRSHRCEVASRWFAGSAGVLTYELDDLLGTKVRALFQRRKGRDLFDLALARRAAPVDAKRVVECFARSLAEDGDRVTRAVFEKNLAPKLRDQVFAADITPLLAPGHAWDMEAALEAVLGRPVALLPGDPWKG